MKLAGQQIGIYGRNSMDIRNEYGEKCKNSHMKRTVIALALICAFLFSCGTDAYASFAVSESQDQKTTEVSDDCLHPVSSIEFMREWINEINQSDELMEQQGFHAVRKTLFMSFVEDDTPYTPIENIAAEGSGVHAAVVMRVEEADSNESSVFSMTAVLLANGKPVNFRLNENSSREGILTVSLNSNQDYIMSLSAEDLPADEGENKLILVVFGYCKDQDFYLNPQSITGFFQSAVKNDGTSAVPCAENEIDIVTIQNRSELGQYARMDFLSDEEMTDFQSDHYGNYLMTSKPEPTLFFYIDNMNNQGQYDNSKGIMFLLIDGELKPVWNGSCFGEISMQDSDLLKVIRLESGFQTGEQHHIYWYYQETEGITDWPAWASFRMKIKTE